MRSVARSYFKSLFLWNPLFAAGFTVTFGGFEHFGRRWLVGLTISTIVSQGCYLSCWIASFLAGRRLSRSTCFGISFLAMPPSLYVAFRVMGISSTFENYWAGVFMGSLVGGFF